MYDGYYIYAPTETLQVAEDVELEDNGLIKKKGYLYVGSTGVQHSSGDDYTYRLGNDGKANGNASYKDANASDYGDILYKKENTEYKYAKNTSYTFTSNPEEAQKDSDYILKSYVQYSARYVRGNKDITINYTLDNYLNIVGTIDKIYYTKTGYLIKENLH